MQKDLFAKIGLTVHCRQKRQRIVDSESSESRPQKSARSDQNEAIVAEPVVPVLDLGAEAENALKMEVDGGPDVEVNENYDGEAEEGEVLDDQDDEAGPSHPVVRVPQQQQQQQQPQQQPIPDTSNDNEIALALQEAEISALLYNVDGVTPKSDLRKDTAPVNVHQKEEVLTAIANVIAGCHVRLEVPMTDV